MNYEISDQFAKRIEAVVGNSDQSTIDRIIDRVSSDDGLLKALVLDEPTETELQDSVAMCDRSLQEFEEGKGIPFDDAMRRLADKHGFDIQR